jgi:GNAT superfamily N-acetyltransferase
MNLQLHAYREANHREACIAIFKSNVPRYFRSHEFDEFLNFLDAVQCHYFVVTLDEQVRACGGFGVREGSSVADLCWGMAHADYHGQGIGTFLLFARLFKIATETNATAVRLGTCQLTDGFFQRFGFAIQSLTTDGLAEGLDDVQMQMILTEDVRETIIQHWHKMQS